MIRRIGASLLLMSGLTGTAAHGQDPFRAEPAGGALAQPGNYSFAPQTSAPGGVASVTYGSRNLSAASIEMDSGLIGNTGTRAFVALGAAHGPDLWHSSSGGRSGVTAQSTTIGLEKAFANGTTVSIGGGWDRAQLGRSR